MKKIVSITMMMVAIMVATFSFVSCGSDDDNKNQYRLEVSLKITEPGNLTQEECEKLIADAAKQNIVADHNSEVPYEDEKSKKNYVLSPFHDAVQFPAGQPSMLHEFSGYCVDQISEGSERA